MKTQIGKLLNAQEAINEIMMEKLPAKLSYRLGSLVEEIAVILKPFNDVKQKMFEEWGEKSKDGQTMSIKQEHFEKFKKEMESLVTEEVELKYKPMELSELGELKISPVAMAHLQDYFYIKD
jgi:hypothetical protein